MNRSMAARARIPKPTLVEEPCTLVYTLLSASQIPYCDFSLIVRSLHKYMVEDIIEKPETRSLHVKLGYQASIKNAYLKMGPTLAQNIFITKLSQFVKEEELSQLACLRRKYGFGPAADAPALEEEDDGQSLTAAAAEFYNSWNISEAPPKPKKRRATPLPITVEEDEGQEHS